MSLRRSFAWMTVSQTSLFVLQFGSSVAMARLLAPYEMGIFAVAAATSGIISTIQAFGLANFLIRESEQTPELLTTSFTVNAILNLLVAGLIASCSIAAGKIWHSPGVAQVMPLLALSTFVTTFQFLPSALMQRGNRFKHISLINFVQAVVSATTTIVLAFAGLSYMSMAWGLLAGALVSTAAFNLIGREHISLRLGLSDWRKATRFGLQMLAISGVNTIASRASEMLLGRVLGLDALGLYSRASNLNNLLWDKIHIVISRILLAKLADQKRKHESLRSVYLNIIETITALLWPAFAGVAILSKPAIYFVYGENWIGAAVPLSMLSLAAIILVAISMTWEVFVVCGETSKQARFEVFRTGIGFGLFALGCLFNVTAASAGRVGEAIFSIILYRPHLDRMTDTTMADLLPIYGQSALLTVAAAGPALLFMTAQDWSYHIPALELAGVVLIGISAWFAGLVALGHPLLEEISRLLRFWGRIIPTVRAAG